MNVTRSPREIGHLWFENVWNQRDRSLVPVLMAADAIGHLEGGQEIVGPEGFFEFQSSFLEAVPDLRIQIVDILADENDVCVHWQARGIHSGAGLGMKPTGKDVSFRGLTWLRVRDGQIVDGWDFWNMGGVMQRMAAPDA